MSALYIKCHARGCGKRMICVGQRDGQWEFVCPDGHRRWLTERYMKRFVHAGAPNGPPSACATCGVELHLPAFDARLCQLICGQCGTVYVLRHGAWEIADVQ